MKYRNCVTVSPIRRMVDGGWGRSPPIMQHSRPGRASVCSGGGCSADKDHRRPYSGVHCYSIPSLPWAGTGPGLLIRSGVSKSEEPSARDIRHNIIADQFLMCDR